MKGYLAILLVLITLGCSKPPQKESTEKVLSIRKTECYGSCPTYNLDIFADGYAEIEVINNLDLENGKYAAKLKTEDFNELLGKFRSSSFFDFEDQYMGNVTDLPTTYIYFSDGGNSKEIQDYYGAPDELKELEKSLENLVLELKWKQI